MVVGAPESGPNSDQPGAAYVFLNNNGNWTQQAKLSPPTGFNAPGVDFGMSVAINSDTLVVGESQNPVASQIGSLHEFVRNGTVWNQTFVMVPNEGPSSQLLSNSVAMADQKTFVFGLPTSNSLGLSNAGGLYIFMQ